jgi:hypothetical protein
MTIRPPSGIPLPELVLVANRVLAEEAEALRTALEDFSNAPQPGCPWELDGRRSRTKSARRHLAGPSFCAMHGIKRC